MTEMTLAEAIAVLHGPDLDTTWIASDFKRGLLPDVVCEALAEVVTAVVSGDLIPRTDARFAEARDAALEEAALVADAESHARLARQIANADLSGIALMHGQVAEAMKSLAVAIRNLKGPTP